MANSIHHFKDEKLIPLIHITRKLLSCDVNQQLDVLQKLHCVFRCHEASRSLLDIVVAGLCQYGVYDRIPTKIYEEIQMALPSDNQLNLKDTVYESRLMQIPEDSEAEQSTNQKKKRLPWTLLRIPTDLQCQIFHFLDVRELRTVQKVCRAMCIAARNPLSLHQLAINLRFPKNHHFMKQILSKPKALVISSLEGSQPVHPLIGISKWGEHVIDLTVDATWTDTNNINLNLAPFVKLRNCTIDGLSSILFNGTISSYHTLRELYLDNVVLTEDIIAEIQRFQNLEILSLKPLRPNPDEIQQLDPISFPKLRALSFTSSTGFPLFLRILIGSHPMTINYDSTRYNSISGPLTPFPPVPDTFAVQQLNIREYDGLSVSKALSGWLANAQCASRNVFDQLNVVIDLKVRTREMNEVVSCFKHLFGCSTRSRMELECYIYDQPDCDVADLVNGIYNAPFGTFTEIKVKMVGDPFGDVKPLHMTDDECQQSDHEAVKRKYMKRIDGVEEWMEQWFVFDETKMKQIGLQQLIVELECDVFDVFGWAAAGRSYEEEAMARRYNRILSDTSHEWIKERVDRWNTIDRKGLSITTGIDPHDYTITFCLCI